MSKTPRGIPTRPFGRTGERVSIIGLGGWHLGVPKTDRAAVRLLHAAIDNGITFLDNAWDYNDGLSEERMGKAIADRRDEVFLMTKVCTHGRDGKVAMRQLEDSLRRLRTDHLDLWQIHEVVFDDEPARHFARGGVVEALDRARRQGKVRYVGFTGHKSPSLHLEMLARDYPWDSCQLPLNCFDASFRSFEREVLPELNRRGIAPIGMKSLSGDARPVMAKVVSARGSPRLRPQPPGRDGRQRDRHAGECSSRISRWRRASARCPPLRGRRCDDASPRTLRTGASSCTRSPRRSKASKPGACTGCRRSRPAGIGRAAESAISV